MGQTFLVASEWERVSRGGERQATDSDVNDRSPARGAEIEQGALLRDLIRGRCRWWAGSVVEVVQLLRRLLPEELIRSVEFFKHIFDKPEVGSTQAPPVSLKARDQAQKKRERDEEDENNDKSETEERGGGGRTRRAQGAATLRYRGASPVPPAVMQTSSALLEAPSPELDGIVGWIVRLDIPHPVGPP